MYKTTYHRAGTVDEAAALFAKGSEAKYLAGGHTLLPVMKQRLAGPSDVIDVAKIKDLVGIDVSGDTVTIKAATTHYDVAQNGAVQKAIPALAHLASVIGDPAVRYRGTLGGSIANNDPAADYPAAVLALGATVKTNKRTIAADSFFKGLFETALENGELITAGVVPDSCKGRLQQVPASGLALRVDRCVRGQDQGRRCPGRCDRREPGRRDARRCDRERAEGKLGGERARQHQDRRQRADGRYPWLGGLQGQPDQGDGAARGAGRGLIFTARERGPSAEMPAALSFSATCLSRRAGLS